MATSKKVDDDLISVNCNVINFLESMANLYRSGIRSPDVLYVKRTFSLIVTFYLTETESRTKKSITNH